MEWTVQAACKGKTHLFFAPAREREAAREIRVADAIALCNLCPVRAECAGLAQDEEYGVWAGTALKP